MSSIAGSNLKNLTNVAQVLVYNITPVNTSGGTCFTNDFKLSVVINPKAQIKDTTITICSGNSFNITPANGFGGNLVPSGTTYTWTVTDNPNVTGEVSNTAAGISTISGILNNTTDNVQTVVYIVTPRAGTCSGSPFKVSVIVNSTPRVLFSTANQTICSGERTREVALLSPTPGTVISWSAIQPAGIAGLSTSGSTTIPVHIFTNNTIQPITITYKAVANIIGGNVCSGDTSRYTITVNPTPRVKDTAFAICSGKNFSLTPASGLGGNIIPTGTAYTWVVEPNINVTGPVNQTIGQASISGVLTNLSDNVQTVVYTVTPRADSQGNCAGIPFKMTVTVNPSPRVIFSPSSQTICSGDNSQQVLLVSPTAGASIFWAADQPVGITGVIKNGTSIIPSQTLVNSTTSPVVINYQAYALINGCWGDTAWYFITVNPKPAIRDTTIVLCGASAFSYVPVNANGNIIPAGTTYVWTVSSNVNVTGQANQSTPVSVISGFNLKNQTSVPQILVYTVTPVSGQAGYCSGTPFKVTIVLNPGSVQFSIPNQTICSGQTTANVNLLGSPNSGAISWVATITQGIIGATSTGTGAIAPQTMINTTTNSLVVRYLVFTGSQSAGCSGGDTSVYTITVHPKPIIFVNGSTLFSTVDLPKQWFLSSAPIAGANLSSYTPVQSGAYTVKVVSTGCVSDTFNYVFTSLNQLEEGEEMRISPNPAGQTAQIIYKQNRPEETVTIRVVTALGRQVSEWNKVRSGAYLSLDTLPAGMYFCLISIGENRKTIVQKLVKW